MIKLASLFLLICFVLGGTFFYLVVWPEIGFYRFSKRPLTGEDPSGFREALANEKECMQEQLGRLAWGSFMRTPRNVTPEDVQKVFVCLSSGKRFRADLGENRTCFIRWWGEDQYREAQKKSYIPSSEDKERAWWCFSDEAKKRYGDKAASQNLFDSQTTLLRNRSCFIASWGEDQYRGYLIYPRDIEEEDTKKAGECF